jgi:hypothetical protein
MTLSVQKSIQVRVPQMFAFGVFTIGLSRWWPPSVVFGKSPRKKVLMEPQLNGRWFEIAQDGARTVIAKVIVWEPPSRFVLEWYVDSRLRVDSKVQSEVDIRFAVAESTSVELVHHKFHAADTAELRDTFDRAWQMYLESYAARAESEAAGL